MAELLAHEQQLADAYATLVNGGVAIEPGGSGQRRRSVDRADFAIDHR